MQDIDNASLPWKMQGLPITPNGTDGFHRTESPFASAGLHMATNPKGRSLAGPGGKDHQSNTKANEIVSAPNNTIQR